MLSVQDPEILTLVPDYQISILINAGIFLKSLTPGMEENQL